MQLTHEQKVHLYEKGYVKLPGVVPKPLVERARKHINHSVGNGMNVDEMITFRAQSFCPEVKNTEVISDLYNGTPIRSMAESVIGKDMLHQIGGAQIALRFPMLQDPPGKPGAHIDGTYSPHNGVKQGQLSNFTGLVGVFLSDVPEPNSGNFTVWPGTHHLFAEYVKKNGPESLISGMPKIDMPEPVQITANAGDAVLCHYLLAHGIAPNVSANIRYGIFFRLTHIEHRNDWTASLKDIWLHWPGVKETLQLA